MGFNLREAYIEDFWPRSTVAEFGYILKYFSERIGIDGLTMFEFTREGYRKIAAVSDDLIIEALLAKKAAKNENRRVVVADVDNPQELYAAQDAVKNEAAKETVTNVAPAHPMIRDYNIDDFVEILVKIKEIAANDHNFDDLDKEREDREKEKEAEAEVDRSIRIHLPFGWIMKKEKDNAWTI